MPPSPSLRRSPGLEPRGDIHKRGHSFESGLSFKERDDDLALFNEMQSRETDNFLLQPTNDFEDILSSRVKPFPDFKLGINIPARGESSDLLNADGDKNDYDWLLTPPETPLFPSLDDEPEPVNVVHGGRDRSRPISISRSSTMERSHRSSRGSQSPQRLSPSPRSGSSTFRGRPSSAPNATPVSLRPGTPSRRPSPPPVKPSTPPPRSSTPTSRRTSTGSGGSGSGGSGVTPGLRGTSPVRTSRGNSASPKIKAWQSNVPSFSLEAPPNLRTSLSDRPASYVRGSSPASRTSRDSPSRRGRQSMSPTASRSISSPHSQERDRLSAHSNDDDADSMQSVPMSISDRPMSRRGVGGFPNSRSVAFSKKPTKTFSPSSAPKRPFDSAIRQMDRKSPQNMFRPLLSSVPSSTFYAGKVNVAHRPMISRNSSVTTSSNASSDQATCGGAHDTEGSDLYQDDMASDCARTPFSDIQDEVFAFDKMDVTIEDAGLKTHDQSSEVPLGKPDKNCTFASNSGDFVKTDTHENSLLCSRCGCQYHAYELIESEHNLCPECKQKDDFFTNPAQLIKLETAQNTSEESNVTEEDRTVCTPTHVTKSSDKSDSNVDVAEGTGISVLLLNRSNSVKGPLIHGRTLNSSAISYDDLSYTRDLTSSMRSSTGHGSMSTSSSMDFASSARHGEMVMQRQSSGKRSSDTSSKGFGVSTSSHEEAHEGSVTNTRNVVTGKATGSPPDQVLPPGNAGLDDTVEANSEVYMSSREKEASFMAGHMEDNELDNSQASIGIDDEGNILSQINEDPQKSVGIVQNVEESGFLESSLAEETTLADNRDDQMEVAKDPYQRCSLSTVSEIEIQDSHPSSPSSQVDLISREDLEDASAVMYPDKDVKGSSMQSIESNSIDGIVEESTVTVEEQGGRRTRSLTLEEATDTILFCSSIVHDLAYKAATIAIEREKENLEPLEGSRPTVTIPEKHSFYRNDPPGRTSKSQKPRKRRAETEAEPPQTKTEERSNDDKLGEPVVRNVGLPNNGDSMKPVKLESKCNCTIM